MPSVLQLRVIGCTFLALRLTAAAPLHHALGMHVYTSYIAKFGRHSHPTAIWLVSSVTLVTTHGVMVAMQCVMVSMHALDMQVLRP